MFLRQDSVLHGAVGGNGFERLFADHGAASSLRQPDRDLCKFGFGGGDALVGPQHLTRLLEAQTLTREQSLEPYGHRAQSARLRGGSPLPPEVIPVVQIDPLDDDGQIRAKAAALLEAAEDLVVVVDDPQPDLGAEVLGLGSTELVPLADEADHAVDEREVREKRRLVGGGLTCVARNRGRTRVASGHET